MDVWLIRGADRHRALTIDHAGAVLPAELGPWRAVRMVSLEGGTSDEDEALALVAEHGWCCFEEDSDGDT